MVTRSQSSASYNHDWPRKCFCDSANQSMSILGLRPELSSSAYRLRTWIWGILFLVGVQPIFPHFRRTCEQTEPDRCRIDALRDFNVACRQLAKTHICKVVFPRFILLCLYKESDPKNQNTLTPQAHNPIYWKPQPQKTQFRTLTQNLNPQTTIKSKNEDKIFRIALGKYVPRSR